MTAARALVGAIAAVAAAAAWGQESVSFTPPEVALILRHGPWPQPAPRDPSNRVSGNPAAIALGQRLFFDARLSANGAVACATCHAPAKAWTDGRRQAAGLASLDRNAPSILDAGRLRWFSWDGGTDSLWAQALRAMLDPREMGAGAPLVAKVVRSDPALECRYRVAFGGSQPDDERLLVDAAKAIAAFVETRTSGRAPFDEFRDALTRGDREAAARYPLAAQRGLQLFVGKGNCSVCHFGASFTNGEFTTSASRSCSRRAASTPGGTAGSSGCSPIRTTCLGSTATTSHAPRRRRPATSSCSTPTSGSSRRRACGTSR
jgi:cytochrome c peroxidase